VLNGSLDDDDDDDQIAAQHRRLVDNKITSIERGAFAGLGSMTLLCVDTCWLNYH
jgi:hypothetical protein